MVVLLVAILVSLVSGSYGYQQCFTKPLQKNPDAEARFSVIISLRETVGEKECQEIKPSAIMTLAAIDWSVSRLNNATLVPGVKFGYDVYDDCGIERYTMYSTLDAMSYYFPQNLTSCTGNTSKYYLGILGASYSTTTQQVLSMVENTDIPVVSPFATYPDLRNSKNFFRTIPSDEDQVQVFVKLMIKQKWNYVVAMYTNDNYGQYGVTKIAEIAKKHKICVNIIPGFNATETFDNQTYKDIILEQLLSHIDNTSDGTLGVLYFGQRTVIQQLLNKLQLSSGLKQKLRNIKWIFSESVGTKTFVLSDAKSVTNEALTVSIASIDLSYIEQYYKVPWSTSSADDIVALIKNFFMRNPGPVSDKTDYIVSVLDAVFSITLSLKTAFDIRCSGYKVICDGFDAYYNYRKLETMNKTIVNYTFLGQDLAPSEFVSRNRMVGFNTTGDFIPDSATPLYNINLYKDSVLKQVGKYIGSDITFNSDFPGTSPTSICEKGCKKCEENPNIYYEFVEGDVYIIGFFSLHRFSDDPFDCSDLRNNSYDVLSVEAFVNSIKEAQTDTGIKFGGIAFDDCYSPTIASMIISDLFSGKLNVPSNSKPIDPSKIVGVVGPFSSGVTVPVTFLLSSLSIPSISYASTSPDLDDKTVNFPYFFRTVPSDVDQAQAMVDILKYMGWKSVGLVYVNNNYGSKGKEAFKKIANTSGICVLQEIVVTQEYNEKSNSDAYIALKNVIDNSGTNLFIYYGTDGRMIDILTFIRSQERSIQDKKHYIFIGSDDWGDSLNIKDTFGDMVEGSLTFKIKSRKTKTNFVQNIVKKTSSVDTSSFWYKQFFKNYYRCHFQDDFVKTFPQICPNNITIPNADVIMANGIVSHCILAVKALTQGIKEAKDQCDDCTENKKRLYVVLEKISNIQLQDDNMISFSVFDKNRNGNIGFQILQIVKVGNSYVYYEVGSYENGNLVIWADRVKSAIGTNLKVSSCAAANIGGSTGESVTSYGKEDFRTAEIIIIALLGSICVALTLVIVAVVFCFWRRMSVLKKMLDETKARITYYNEIGTAKRKQKHANKKNGDIGFDNPIFLNGGPALLEPPGQHYFPLQDSDATNRSSHKYDGNSQTTPKDMLNTQTTPKHTFNSQETIPDGARPDLPPRNALEKKVASKSESDIHSSYPKITQKMGNYFGMSNQPRMGTAIQTTPTDSLHSLTSVFSHRNHSTSSPNEATMQHYNDDRPLSKSQPSSPRSPNEFIMSLRSPSEKRIPSHSSPLSHNNSIHSQFSGDTLHMTGNLSPQRRKRLKSFSSEEPQKISRV